MSEYYEQFLQTALDYIHDNAVKLITGLILLGLGWYFGRIRAAAAWRKQEFLDRLNISLNTLEYPTWRPASDIAPRLKIRTLSEKRCEEVFLNSAAAANIKKYAKLTTEENPILQIPKDEYWFYLNSILNDLSEQFAVGLLKKDIDGFVAGSATDRVLTKKYLLALTCEAAGEMKTRKIRAMVIGKDSLLNLLDKMDRGEPILESPNHITRWDTLKKMAAFYETNPELFLEVELSV